MFQEEVPTLLYRRRKIYAHPMLWETLTCPLLSETMSTILCNNMKTKISNIKIMS